MKKPETVECIRHEVIVPVSIQRAFKVFTEKFGTWWPARYTWSAGDLERIAIEPRQGGRCFERDIHGNERLWGRVLVWVPPERVEFTWQITPERQFEPDPQAASRVEVRFAACGPGITQVILEHRDFERHGQGAQAYRDGMDSEQGWPLLLDRYAEAVR